MRSLAVACALVCVGAGVGAVRAEPPAADERLPLGVFRFRHFGAGEGLHNLVVWALAQDDAGMIWVGTDDGAYRYDGARFTHYSVAEGLPASAVTVLGVAPDGQVCAGGGKGLACWDPVAHRFGADGTAGLPVMPIRAIARRRDQLWIGTDRGLFVRSAGSFAPAPGWPGEGPVFALWADAAGVVAAFNTHVAAGNGEGAWQVGGGEVASGPDPIDGVARDAAGLIWLRTAVKMSTWSPATQAFRDVSDGLPPGHDSAGRATALAIGAAGDIWVGTDRGPAFFRDGRWQVASRERGFTGGTVRALLVDHEGSTWVGATGLWQWTGRTLTERHDEASGFPGSIAWTIGRDRDGQLFAGTDHCLVRATHDAWQCQPGTTDRIVRAFVSLPDGGSFLGGAPADLLYLDPMGRATSIKPEPFRPEDHILTLARFGGDLWVGTRTRLFRLVAARPGPLEPVAIRGVAFPTRVSHLLEIDGALWMTTEVGVAVLDRGVWHVFDTHEGLRAASTRYLVHRADGRVCVSYNEAIGLSCFRYDGIRLGSFEHFGEAEGLAAGMVYFLGEDLAGRLWVGTGNGIDVVTTVGQVTSVDHFGEEDGLAGNDGAAKAIYRDRDGALWMGASGGLSRVEAQHYLGPPLAPRTRMMDGKLGGRDIALDRSGPLVASHDANALWVSYATGSYLDPSRLLVQTRLWPVESEWSSSNSEVRTPVLPAGAYRLEARARLGAGAWGPAAQLVFDVEPAWWERTWIIVALAGAALGVFGALIAWRYRARVRRRTRQLIAQAEDLELRVQARTAELDERNRGMRRMLDSVAQGFVTIDLDGVMAPERSAIVETWLGPLPPGTKLTEILADRSPESDAFALWLDIALDSLRQQLMPYDVIAMQLQTRFTIDDQIFDVAFSPILVGDEVSRLLLVISDVTAHVARENAEREERDLFAIFQRINSDRTGFNEFVHDAGELVRSLEDAIDVIAERRIVHTLKGNCALFGLEGYAEVCHRVEAELEAQEPEPLTRAQRDRLAASWREMIGKVMAMLGGGGRSVVEVERSELAIAIQRAQHGGSGRELAQLLASWAHEPVSRRFERLARHAVQLARQLGKGTLAVAIRDGGLRLDTARWAAFWAALVHVVRNAVDHGIESPAQRLAAGKPEHGTLTLAASADADRVRISISDDGSGIDWDLVRSHAALAGLPSATRTDLEDALFIDGVTTRDQVTITSGRGVGLATLRHEVRTLGGTIAIATAAGLGTTLTFEFPADGVSVVSLEHRELAEAAEVSGPAPAARSLG